MKLTLQWFDDIQFFLGTLVVELFPCASVLSPSPSPSASFDPFTEKDKKVTLWRCDLEYMICCNAVRKVVEISVKY